MATTLRDLVDELLGAFRAVNYKRAAHHLARPILEEASREPALFREALAAFLSRPESLNRKNYPVVTVPITANAHFELVVNCWIPLPNGDTDLTTKAIHHHGDMLLSTATIFGPGYDHWLFSRPRRRPGASADDLVHTMSVIDASPHRLHEVAFVDDHVPHVPIYPRSLSLTLALWSTQHDVSMLDRIKRIPLFKKNSRALKETLTRLGLQRALSLKVPEYFDFVPLPGGGFEAMKERKEFDLGPNEDYLQSLFHVILTTGNSDLAATVEGTLATGLVENPAIVERLTARLKAEQPIEGKLSAGHYDVPFANYRTADILQGLGLKDESVENPLRWRGRQVDRAKAGELKWGVANGR